MNLTFGRTYLAISSRKASRTFTSIRSNPIYAGSVIFTWLNLTIINICNTKITRKCSIPITLKFLLIFKSMAILVSQSYPLNPAGHAHVYEATPSWHVPPLLQGSPIQSSISENYKLYFTILI